MTCPRPEIICMTCPMNFGLNAHPADTPQQLLQARSVVLEGKITPEDVLEEKLFLSPHGVKAVFDCVELNLDGEDCYDPGEH